MFNDTIEANIKYGKVGATQEEVKTASRSAKINDQIMQFTEDYKTVVGEGGHILSGNSQLKIICI